MFDEDLASELASEYPREDSSVTDALTEHELQQIERQFTRQRFDECVYCARGTNVAQMKTIVFQLVAALRAARKSS